MYLQRGLYGEDCVIGLEEGTQQQMPSITAWRKSLSSRSVDQLTYTGVPERNSLRKFGTES